MPTRIDKYYPESGRGDGQGDVEKEDPQSYLQPYMKGKAREKKIETIKHLPRFCKKKNDTALSIP